MAKVNRIHDRPRRRRSLVVAIVALLAVAALVVYTPRFIARHFLAPGSSDESRTPPSQLGNDDDSSPTDVELREQMEAMGYLAGSIPAPKVSGTTVYDAAQAYNGLNLSLSGHGFVASLLDMEGQVLHTWRLDNELVYPAPSRRPTARPRFFERAHLYPNGDLLVIVGEHGIAKLDRDSKLLWILRDPYHHDIDVLDDGSIYTLVRKFGHIPIRGEEQPTYEDFVCLLDSTGAVLRKISIPRALLDSSYAHLLDKGANTADLTHTNSLQYLDGALASVSPLFKKGNVLVSCRTLDAVAIIDLETEQAVWAMAGPWDGQHSVSLLDSGRMLVFDNRRLGARSRVIEFDPFSGTEFWIYGAKDAESFFSASAGFCERLPNGNTLIVESNSGRAFEVNRDKTIVWDFTNPHRVGVNSELIAALYDLVRLPPDFPVDWIPPNRDRAVSPNDLGEELQ